MATDLVNLPVPGDLPVPVEAGLQTAQGFELLQRMAKLLAASALVPKEFQGNLSNCVIALDLAQRLNASPLAVCQNIYIVHGKPSWSSTFIIAAINSTDKFSPLRFSVSAPEPEREVTADLIVYDRAGNRTVKTVKERIANRTCIAWAIEKATGERLESPPVSIEMAVREGWYSKDGSKWRTMEQLMLRYRCATLFGRLYAPEVLMGMLSVEEAIDITPPESVEPRPGESRSDRLARELSEAKPEAPPAEMPTAPTEQKAEAPAQVAASAAEIDPLATQRAEVQRLIETLDARQARAGARAYASVCGDAVTLDELGPVKLAELLTYLRTAVRTVKQQATSKPQGELV